jgi:hypothetical protein
MVDVALLYSCGDYSFLSFRFFDKRRMAFFARKRSR